jgi:ribose transport system substrate-binding protein
MSRTKTSAKVLAAVGLAAAVVLSGCSSGKSDTAAAGSGGKTTYTIGLANFTESQVLPQSLRDGVKQAAAELGARDGVTINVVSLDSRQEVARQASQVQDLIAQQVDGIILVPISATASTALVQQAKRANIPIGVLHGFTGDQGANYVDPDLMFQWDVNVFEGASNSARKLVAAIPGGGDIAVVTGPPGEAFNAQSAAGFDPEIAKTPEYKVVSTQPGGWTKEGGDSACSNMFAANRNIKGVYAYSDDMAVGCVSAAKRAGVNPVIIGISGTQAALAAIRDGSMYATDCYQPRDEGAKAMNTMWDVLTKKTGRIGETQYMPTNFITKDNVDTCQSQS